MSDDFSMLSPNERLNAENEFLVLKLMAERGAIIHMEPSNDPAWLAIQNQFLRNIVAFESLHDHTKRVPVQSLVPIQQQFRPLNEIPQEEVAGSWTEMEAFLLRYKLVVSARSPRVTAAELYQFVREELVNQLIPSERPPEMISCFVYDEFHPDYEYDACCAAIEGIMLPLFSNHPAPPDYCYVSMDLMLNDWVFDSAAAFKQYIGDFKSKYDQIHPQLLRVRSCKVDGGKALVKGRFEVMLEKAGETEPVSCDWEAELLMEEGGGCWLIQSLRIPRLFSEPPKQV